MVDKKADNKVKTKVRRLSKGQRKHARRVKQAARKGSPGQN
jgi:hypothetical protein